MARMKKKRIKEKKAKEQAKKWKMEDKGPISPEETTALVEELLAVEGARYEELDGKISIYHPGDE